MGKYDIITLRELEERGKGAVVAATQQGLYRIVTARPETNGRLTDFDMETACDAVTERVVLGGLELQNVEMTADRTNNIVKTAINGRIGTVKEFVSEGDVAIGMTVTLLNKEDEYPWEQVENLKKVLKKKQAIEVESRWLNEVWDVTRVVVESYHMTGHTERNYEVVEISLASDMEYLIEEGTEA